MINEVLINDLIKNKDTKEIVHLAMVSLKATNIAINKGISESNHDLIIANIANVSSVLSLLSALDKKLNGDKSTNVL